jgi:hypothetical protein
VDPQTWEAAQHQIARNSQLSPRNTKRPYLLQSLLVCGYPLEGGTGEETCGHVWAASSDRTRPGWLRYRCYRRYGHGHDGHGCGGWMRATEIEDIVWGWVSAFVTNPAQVLRDMEERAQRGRQSRAGAERAVTLALSRVKRAENALDTLNLKNVTGSLSDEEHARLRPTLLAALEQARLALAEAQERAQQAQVTEATQAEVEAFCREARLVLAAPSFEEKRQLVRALVQRVVVSEQTIEIQVRLRSARLAREGTDCKSGVTALTTATT